MKNVIKAHFQEMGVSRRKFPTREEPHEDDDDDDVEDVNDEEVDSDDFNLDDPVR